ncbi:PilX N-terminal domain-containing pilus assembly protein [Thermosediminibacter litoriperuensis]|uniref:PilX-like prepilin protein n=1 Tax=Thermosediminibacter litoriperuensis TaxID=291989 RepID=A0A5S5ANR2_9FIRM|nr:PilX N-terminal domain-containing pilus assembly protein [Thermosediminibacter litoriperuensis]TYP53297.1 PilX-like prepilin protein [Thermosediminibacter litoriperuensis]
MQRNTVMQGVRGAEQGQALVLVMLVLMVVVILGSATVTLTASHRQTAARQRNRLQAYYAADAGVERALVIIKQNPSGFWSRFPLMVPYAGGSIERVTVEEIPGGPGTGVKITSVGAFNNARRTLVVRARVYTSGGPSELLKGVSLLPEDRDYIQKLNGSVILSSASVKSRPVFYINGNLQINGSAAINGFDIYASGYIDTKGSMSLYDCDVQENYSDIPPFPELDEEWYRDQAVKTNQYYSDEDGKKNYTKSFSQTDYSGVYFVEGNGEISGTYGGNAVIVATGDIEVTSSLTAENPGSDLLVLISLNPDGGVKVNGSASVDALIITSGALRVHGSARIYGGIIARILDINGRAAIICDPDLIDSRPELIGLAFGGGSSPTGIKIESWSEQ